MMQPSQPDRVQDTAQERTEYALNRTYMAATRTYFAMLRTGLAIAGGGVLITSILAEGWPNWIIGLLASIFIIVGFLVMIIALWRYRRLAQELATQEGLDVIAPSALMLLTVLLMIALVVVLALFLLAPA